MPQKLLNVNFGKLKADATGSLGVGYQVLDQTGSIVVGRTTDGVYQAAPGIYASLMTFSEDFVGQVVWDTGTHYFTSTHYATEDYNGNANLDNLYNVVAEMDGKLQSVYDMQFGRWKILNKQMIFFKADNVTEIARFNLLDDSGNLSVDAVFERVKV